MTILKSVYNPSVCCAHDWAKPRDPFYGTSELCVRCGATCTRGHDGSISTYSLNAERFGKDRPS